VADDNPERKPVKCEVCGHKIPIQDVERHRLNHERRLFGTPEVRKQKEKQQVSIPFPTRVVACGKSGTFLRSSFQELWKVSNDRWTKDHAVALPRHCSSLSITLAQHISENRFANYPLINKIAIG
jgi:hypothetical protein